MSTPKQFPFGRPNFETAGRWLGLAPELDGPVWMVNLMKYRAVADYGDGVDGGGAEGSAPVTGKQADDAYAPLGPLAAIGAVVAFHGDVTAQASGEPEWDRIGIVRYASRASFFAMQERDDFKKQYTHKKAGMEFTIVMGCLPTFADAGLDESPADGASYVMRVRRFADGATPGDDLAGVRPVATFEVDGVILGDDRRWDEVRFDLADDAAIALMQETSGVDEQVIVRVDRSIDRLVETVITARQ